MKKLIFLLSIMLAVVFVNAQTTPTEVTPDSKITKEYYKYVFGTTADTITNADNTSFVYRVKGTEMQDLNLQLYMDNVSGTASGTVITYRSIDGVTYGATGGVGDTITFTSVSADAMQADVINLDDFLFPYLKITYVQTGTAVIVPRVYVYSKKN